MAENRFEIGKTYRGSSLYGSIIYYTVSNRNDNTLTMKETWISEDTGNEVFEFTKFDIQFENGIEKICIWEYHGHEAFIYANEGR